MWMPPSYPMKRLLVNRLMKKLTLERVVPIISASISCDILGSVISGGSWLP